MKQKFAKWLEIKKEIEKLVNEREPIEEFLLKKVLEGRKELFVKVDTDTYYQLSHTGPRNEEHLYVKKIIMHIVED